MRPAELASLPSAPARSTCSPGSDDVEKLHGEGEEDLAEPSGAGGLLESSPSPVEEQEPGSNPSRVEAGRAAARPKMRDAAPVTEPSPAFPSSPGIWARPALAGWSDACTWFSDGRRAALPADEGGNPAADALGGRAAYWDRRRGPPRERWRGDGDVADAVLASPRRFGRRRRSGVPVDVGASPRLVGTADEVQAEPHARRRSLVLQRERSLASSFGRARGPGVTRMKPRFQAEAEKKLRRNESTEHVPRGAADHH